MHGPIDYIIVGFEGNKFDGSVLKALGDAIDSGVIALVTLALVSKDKDGNVLKLDVSNVGDAYAVEFVQKYHPQNEVLSDDDINEVADLLQNNTSAGLLVVEQLWAKPLKKALIDANGVLVAEGRIHPEAALEIDQKEED